MDDDIIGGRAAGPTGERATGTPNTIYDLSSVLFHALEGGASYDTYIEDAEREGDQELVEFFRQVRDEDSNRADRAQQLLAERTPTTSRSEGVVVSAEGVAAGVPPRTEPISAPPGPGDVPPRRTEEEVSPRPEPTTDLPGTEPIREDVSTARAGEVPPPPEEVPPETAGEIPTAEEVPPPRTEEVQSVREAPSGTPLQAPPGGVEPPVPGGIPHEGVVPPTPPLPRGEPGDAQSGISPGAEETPRTGEGRTRQEEKQNKDLIDKAKDYLLGEDREREGRER